VTKRICATGFFLLAVSLLLPACAINPRVDLAGLSAAKSGILLNDVPFFPQKKYQCGPAALAGILQYSGVGATPGSLVSEVYVPARKGSLQVEMLAATRRAGRVPYVLGGEVRHILTQLEAGRPVLVLQNLLTPHVPAWHYAVVVGFDAGDNDFILNSGRKRHLGVSAGKFLRTWRWAGYWAVVALRPGDVPAGAEPMRFMQAVAAFEAVAGGALARPSWQAAAKAWPQSSRPHLALGNLAYFDGNLRGAVAHYQDGLRRDPKDPVLINNLASVLGELGCPRAAEQVLRPAFDVTEPGSAWRKDIDATLAELKANQVADTPGCAGYLPSD
jgi:hypothetical protein